MRDLVTPQERLISLLGGKGAPAARAARLLVRSFYLARGAYQGLERRLIARLPARLFYQEQQRYAWHFEHSFARRSFYQTVRRHLGDLPPPTAGLLRFAVVARPATAHFLEPLLSAIEQEAEIFVYPAYDRALLHDLDGLDVVWLEWGTAAFWLAELGAQRRRRGSPFIVCRIHDHELSLPHHLARAAWDVADALVFINRDALSTFDAATGGRFHDKLVFLPNSIDERTFPLKQSFDSSTVLMLSEGLSPRKNYARALRLFAEAYSHNSALHLHIRADPSHPGSEAASLLREVERRGLEAAVTFLVPTTPAPMRKRLLASKLEVLRTYHDAGAVLSTSDHEGFHYAVAEAMLCGLYPVVYPWSWGRPRDFWGPYVAKSDDDFVARLLRWSTSSKKERQDLAEAARGFAQKHFGRAASRRRLRTLLPAVCKPRKRARRPRRLILFAHNDLHRLNPHGGEKSMARIIEYLADFGYETLVLVQNRKSRYVGRDLSAGFATLCVQPYELRTAAYEVLQWWRPDAALVWELPARDIWDLCVGRALPYVLFIRFWHLVCPPPFVDLLHCPIDPAHREAHRPIFENAARIIVNAQHVGQVLHRYYGVDSTVSYVPVAPLTRITPAHHKRFVTLINARKCGGGALLRALAQALPEREFLLIDGDGGAYPENVTVRPYDTRPYNEMLADTRVLLFPFDNEPCGTGRVALEAYHLGIPVIAPKKGGLPEVIPASHLVGANEDIGAWARTLTIVEQRYEADVARVGTIVRRFDERAQLDIVRAEIEAAIGGEGSGSLSFGPPADAPFVVAHDGAGALHLSPLLRPTRETATDRHHRGAPARAPK